jgi:Zn-dependent M28 family amino/carboxypeptidase
LHIWMDEINFLGIRFPAADDNTSSVVDILELARVLSGYSLSRTVVLLFSSGEEQGTLGVQSYLSALSQEELSSSTYVVNIDMVGYDESGEKLMELWYRDDPPSTALAQMMSETIKTYHLDLVPSLVVGYG